MSEAGVVIADKYRLVEVLGKGATGTVWRALQLGLDRPVAVKVLHPQIAAREEAAVRFAREARVAASLDHPSSVGVLDFGEDTGRLYLVMELVDGESLRARLRRGAIPLSYAVTIGRQVAMALAAAHRIRLVHRDIKPENVILPNGTPPPPAKVVDFGLAFIVDPDDARQIGRVTIDGTVAGTPAYMSPEQVRGGSIGPPSDVYSLGCLLYEMFGGRPPFVGALGEVLTRHAYAPPLELRHLEMVRPPPPALDELVMMMLSKSPSSRPTASRVVAALGAYEDPHEERAGRSSVPVIERQRRAVPTMQPAASAPSDSEIEIGVLGEIDSELELALAASGIRTKRWAADEVGTESIVWATDVPVAVLAALAQAGKSVVTDVSSGEASALPALVHAGIADAIVRPHDADDLVRRLWRVHRLRASPR